MNRLPDDGDLCSQPTISRLENLPDARALLRMGRDMLSHYCQSFRQVPRRIVLNIDDTFDAVHGGQQLQLFNAHYDEYGFQPIVVFDGDGRMIAAVLRPASRPSGKSKRLLMATLPGECLSSCLGAWKTPSECSSQRLPQWQLLTQLLHPGLRSSQSADLPTAQSFVHAWLRNPWCVGFERWTWQSNTASTSV